MRSASLRNALAASVLLVLAACDGARTAARPRMLNVSYDPTRELYRDITAAFTRHHNVEIQQSHGGSGLC